MAAIPGTRSDPEFRHFEALLFWELRRWLFNLTLVPAAFVGYLGSFPFLLGRPLPPQPNLGETALGIVGWGLGANTAFSVVYLLERLFGAHSETVWRRFGREFVVFLPTTAAIALTFGATRRLSGWLD